MLRQNVMELDTDRYTYRIYFKKQQNGKGRQWYLSGLDKSLGHFRVVKFSRACYTIVKNSRDQESILDRYLLNRKVVTAKVIEGINEREEAAA